jgi:chromosome partitioning protein
MQREFILKDLLEPIVGDYDFILLDCPPSLGLITINAFVAADEVYIPLTAEALPFKGLAMIKDIISMVQKRLNPSLKLSGIIISRWENSKLSSDVEAALRQNFGDVVFNTKIRKNIAVAEAPLSKKDILSYSSSCNGAKDYRQLTQEIVERCK